MRQPANDGRHHDLVADELHQPAAACGDDLEGTGLEPVDLLAQRRRVEARLELGRPDQVDEPDGDPGQLAASHPLLGHPLAVDRLAHVVAENRRQPAAEVDGQLGGLDVGPQAGERVGPRTAQVLLGALDVHGDRGLRDPLHRAGYDPEEVLAPDDPDHVGVAEPLHQHDVRVGELGGVEVGDDDAEVAEHGYDLVDG
jgi:hypothetical protein